MNRPIASLIDYALLRPQASEKDIEKLCHEAVRWGFYSVCVFPWYVSFCKKRLIKSNVHVCTVIGFPFGANTTETKVMEAKNAIKNGADELDLVINISALKSKRYQVVYDDIAAVRAVAKRIVLKIIIETSLLTRTEKIKICAMARALTVDFVKTSTGFGPWGAKVSDIRLLRNALGPGIGIKASGGIKSLAIAHRMLHAGATRIGTSKNLLK